MTNTEITNLTAATAKDYVVVKEPIVVCAVDGHGNRIVYKDASIVYKESTKVIENEALDATFVYQPVSNMFSLETVVEELRVSDGHTMIELTNKLADEDYVATYKRNWQAYAHGIRYGVGRAISAKRDELKGVKLEFTIDSNNKLERIDDIRMIIKVARLDSNLKVGKLVIGHLVNNKLIIDKRSRYDMYCELELGKGTNISETEYTEQDFVQFVDKFE